MKRLILIIIILLLTGCYDYKEVNNLAFISTIGLDFKEGNYILSFEILNDTKVSEKNSNNKSYNITTKGKTIAKAFDLINSKISNIPYYHHLSALIISKSIATNHFQETIDFFIRHPGIKNEFYMVLTEDIEPIEIIKSTDNVHPVIGNEITDLIESDNYYFNTSSSVTFEDILEKALNDKCEINISSISLKNKDIIIKGIALFKEFKYQKTLNSNESAIFNLLSNKDSNYLITRNYDNKPVSIKALSSKINYKFTTNEIIVNAKVSGEVVENAANINLQNEKNYKKLNKEFAKKLKKEINTFIEKLQNDNIDALNFNNMQYKKTRKNKKDILQNKKVIVNVDFKINKKGLIYDTKNK